MATIVKAYHGFGAIGNNTEESYKTLLKKVPLISSLHHEKAKIVKKILEEVEQFRIQTPYHNLDTNNRLINEGPVKIRYAQLIMQELKKHTNFQDCQFYASNMDDFSPVGMRNTWRILSNQNFDYDEDTFLKGAIKALKHLNPLTPLLNIPNNLLSIIALEHKLKNSNLNFMGETSSSQALYCAINRVSSNRFKEIFVLSSMYLHFNFVNILLYFQHYSLLSRLPQFPISEYAGGVILQNVDTVENQQIEVSFNFSLPPIITNKSFDLRGQNLQEILVDYKNRIIIQLRKQAFSITDFDLILFQGIHQPFMDLIHADNDRLVNITPYAGYNVCANGIALTHFACEYLKHNEHINRVLVIEQGMQGSLWVSVFQQKKDKL